MKRAFLALIVLAVAALGSVSASLASDQTFKAPKYGGNRLDWCYTFGKGCGAKAANAFCVEEGFDKAKSFTKGENVGLTRTIGDQSVCKGSNCDTFKSIVCGANTNTTTYNLPKIQGDYMDWCYGWKTGCGSPAAQTYCKAKGHKKLISFMKAENLKTTRVWSTGQVCDGDNCDGFAVIICE